MLAGLQDGEAAAFRKHQEHVFLDGVAWFALVSWVAKAIENPRLGLTHLGSGMLHGSGELRLGHGDGDGPLNGATYDSLKDVFVDENLDVVLTELALIVAVRP